MLSDVCMSSKSSIVKGLINCSNYTTHAHAREEKKICDAKILNHRKRYEFRDELRYRRTRQGAFENAMLHFDHPLPGGGQILEPSDRGTSAAEIYRVLEPTPLWVILWKRSAAKLPRTGKKVLAALMVDWRSRPAAKIAGVDHKTVDAWKKIFKVHFAQCFRAYKLNLAR